jgi:hypothetical protein
MRRPNSHQHNSEGERSTDNGAIPSAATLLYSLLNQSKKLRDVMILLWSISQISIAQSDAAHHKFYYAIINYTNGARVKSILYDVSDSALLIQGKPGTLIYQLSYYDIDKIKIRKKGSAGTGILVGTGSGILVGSIIGLASYKQPEPASNGWGSITYDPGPGGSAIAGGIFGAIGGLIIGGVIGSLPATTIKINHSYQNFSNAIPTIKNYCPKH